MQPDCMEEQSGQKCKKCQKCVQRKEKHENDRKKYFLEVEHLRRGIQKVLDVCASSMPVAKFQQIQESLQLDVHFFSTPGEMVKPASPVHENSMQTEAIGSDELNKLQGRFARLEQEFETLETENMHLQSELDAVRQQQQQGQEHQQQQQQEQEDPQDRERQEEQQQDVTMQEIEPTPRIIVCEAECQTDPMPHIHVSVAASATPPPIKHTATKELDQEPDHVIAGLGGSKKRLASAELHMNKIAIGKQRQREKNINEPKLQRPEAGGQANEFQHQLQEQIHVLRLSLQERDDLINELQCQLQDCSGRLNEVLHQMQERNGQFEELQCQLQERNGQFIAIQCQLQQRDGNFNSFQSQATDTLVAKKLQDVNRSLVAQEKQLEERDEQINRLQHQLKKCDEQLGQLQCQLQERDEQFSELQLQEREEQFSELQHRLQDRDEKLCDLQHRLQEYDEQNDKLQHRLQELSIQSSEFQHKYQDSKKQFDELQLKLEHSETQRNDVQCQLQELEGQSGELRGQLTETLARMRWLEDQLTSMQCQRDHDTKREVSATLLAPVQLPEPPQPQQGFVPVHSGPEQTQPQFAFKARNNSAFPTAATGIVTAHAELVDKCVGGGPGPCLADEPVRCRGRATLPLPVTPLNKSGRCFVKEVRSDPTLGLRPTKKVVRTTDRSGTGDRPASASSCPTRPAPPHQGAEPYLLQVWEEGPHSQRHPSPVELHPRGSSDCTGGSGDGSVLRLTRPLSAGALNQAGRRSVRAMHV